MAFTNTWNALFAKPLLNQLIALIQRDQAAAIGIVNPSLAPITEFHKSPSLRTALPWLTVELDSLTFAEQSMGTRDSRSRIGLVLDVGQFEQEMAQDNAQDYARVLDMIVTSASESDWETPLPIVQISVPSGVTSPNALGSVKEVYVNSHHYGTVLADEIETPLMRVTINLDFTLEET